MGEITSSLFIFQVVEELQPRSHIGHCCSPTLSFGQTSSHWKFYFHKAFSNGHISRERENATRQNIKVTNLFTFNQLRYSFHVLHYLQGWGPKVKNCLTKKIFRVQLKFPLSTDHIFQIQEAHRYIKSLQNEPMGAMRMTFNSYGKPDLANTN